MQSTTWKLDPSHSEVIFKAKHLMITTVTGQFKQFDAEVQTDGDDFTKATKVRFTAEVDSISTNNEQRDTHLKSTDFFDAAGHPQVIFEGTKLEGNGSDMKLHGNLTMRSTTKPVVFDVEFAGIVTDPYGQVKAGFTIDGKLSRKEYGLTWSAVTEAGQVVVSDEIKIHAEIQLVKQA